MMRNGLNGILAIGLVFGLACDGADGGSDGGTDTDSGTDGSSSSSTTGNTTSGETPGESDSNSSMGSSTEGSSSGGGSSSTGGASSTGALGSSSGSGSSGSTSTGSEEALPYGPCPDGDDGVCLDDWMCQSFEQGPLAGAHWCTTSCDPEGDPCPDPPEGDAMARCRAAGGPMSEGICLLLCTQETVCPSGMECILGGGMGGEFGNCAWTAE